MCSQTRRTQLSLSLSLSLSDLARIYYWRGLSQPRSGLANATKAELGTVRWRARTTRNPHTARETPWRPGPGASRQGGRAGAAQAARHTWCASPVAGERSRADGGRAGRARAAAPYWWPVASLRWRWRARTAGDIGPPSLSCFGQPPTRRASAWWVTALYDILWKLGWVLGLVLFFVGSTRFYLLVHWFFSLSQLLYLSRLQRRIKQGCIL
jgi:hypothetical protein